MSGSSFALMNEQSTYETRLVTRDRPGTKFFTTGSKVMLRGRAIPKSHAESHPNGSPCAAFNPAAFSAQMAKESDLYLCLLTRGGVRSAPIERGQDAIAGRPMPFRHQSRGILYTLDAFQWPPDALALVFFQSLPQHRRCHSVHMIALYHLVLSEKPGPIHGAHFRACAHQDLCRLTC